MKRILKAYATICLLMLVPGGCHYRTSDPTIQTNTLILAKDSRM
jgi:hypothetical protein